MNLHGCLQGPSFFCITCNYRQIWIANENISFVVSRIVELSVNKIAQ